MATTKEFEPKNRPDYNWVAQVKRLKNDEVKLIFSKVLEKPSFSAELATILAQQVNMLLDITKGKKLKAADKRSEKNNAPALSSGSGLLSHPLFAKMAKGILQEIAQEWQNPENSIKGAKADAKNKNKLNLTPSFKNALKNALKMSPAPRPDNTPRSRPTPTPF